MKKNGKQTKLSKIISSINKKQLYTPDGHYDVTINNSLLKIAT